VKNCKLKVSDTKSQFAQNIEGDKKTQEEFHDERKIHESNLEEVKMTRKRNPVRKFDSIDEDTMALFEDMGIRPQLTEYEDDVNALLDDINGVDQDVDALLEDIGMKAGDR